MSTTARARGIDQMGVEERLALVEEIWASICAETASFTLSESQRVELDRRMAGDDAFPEDVVPWDEVKASVRARLTK